MKSSQQTLMLGILMGFLAWVLDALISWHFFPGRTFYEMVFAYDPERTLYVRSTVVMLFFIFGLAAGKLITQSEIVQQKLTENLRLLDGIRNFHAQIVKLEARDPLIEEVLPLIEDAFHLQSLRYFRLDADAQIFQKEFGSQDPVSESLRGQLVAKLPDFKKGEGLHWLMEKGSHGSFLAPVRSGDRLFGVLTGQNLQDSLYRESDRQKHFLAVCDDLGHALAHLLDLEKLNTNAEKLTSLYNNAPVGIFTTTFSGKVLFVNPGMSRLLGVEDPQELLANDLPVTHFYKDPYRRKEFIQVLKQDGFVVDFDASLTGPGQLPRNFLLAARLVGDPEQEDARIEGFAMDVTRSRSAERENRILQKQLAESQHFKSITVLAGGIAHEFNNILQAMMGSAYLAQMKSSQNETEVQDYLQDIQESGKRAARLCDQMLSYAGKKAMLLKLENPDACLEDILKVLAPHANSGVKFSKQFSASQVQARLDIPSFSEIINQLVANAVESFQDGTGLVTLTTESRHCNEIDFAPYHMFRSIHADDYWVLRIEDNGSGISEEDLPHIFEPFYTTKFQGRGLGLPSIAGLVEKFDGSLGVLINKEQGTEIKLWIPQAESVLVEEPELLMGKADDEKSLNGVGKIWVVDDEPLICATIKRFLSQSGFNVETAKDGLEALEKISQGNKEDIRCLILDVTMPRMGGLETLENLRKILPDVPVLIMSGYDESDSLEHFKDMKVAGFIHKPFRMELLENRLKKALG